MMTLYSVIGFIVIEGWRLGSFVMAMRKSEGNCSIDDQLRILGELAQARGERFLFSLVLFFNVSVSFFTTKCLVMTSNYEGYCAGFLTLCLVLFVLHTPGFGGEDMHWAIEDFCARITLFYKLFRPDVSYFDEYVVNTVKLVFSLISGYVAMQLTVPMLHVARISAFVR